MKEKKTGNRNDQMKRLMLSLLPIQALAVGLPSINSLFSSFIVGHFLGTSALAAIGFAAPLTYLTSMLSGAISTGSQIKSGQNLGRGDRKALIKVFNSALAFASGTGILLTLLVMALSSGITVLLGAYAELAEITQSYILGIAPSIALGVIFAVLLSFLQLERAEKESTAAVMTLIAVNTVFNFLNIFLLHWGLFGVGLSMSLADLAAIAVPSWYFLRKSDVFRFSIRDIDFASMKSMVYLGIPSAILPVCCFFRDRILNHFIFLLGGTPAMAALTIAGNIANAIGSTLEAGYDGSSNLIASILVGERDIETLRSLPKTMISGMFPIYLSAYALVFIFARPLALFFGVESAHMELYVMAIRLLNLWYITNSFVTPTIILYRALGKVKTASLFYVLTDLLVPALIAALGLVFGLAFIYSFSWIAEIARFCVYVVYYALRCKKLPRSVFRVTDIPDTLSVPATDRFSTTIRNVRDAMDASTNITDFCEQKKLPAKEAMFCGLCVEELAMDTILHGFTHGKVGRYSIDLHAVYENGEIMIMLRDNCPHFDPKEWLAMQVDSNDDRSLGLRIAAQSAKEMNYTSTLGLNVVTIKAGTE